MKNVIPLLIILFLFGCSSQKESESLYKEVVAIHDEVMPRMEEVSKLSKELKEKLEASETNPNNETIQKSLSNLQKASSGMMNWMREFNSSYDTLPEEKAIEYLKEEKLKIEQVKKDMEAAINEGKQLLQS